MPAYVADVHLHNHSFGGGPVVAGLNRRASAIVGALEEAATFDSKHLFVAGDLFDTASPSPALIAAAARAISRWERATLVVGNHDRSRPGEHALLPLAELPNVQVIADVPTVVDGHLCIPFHGSSRAVDYLDALQAQRVDEPVHTLVLHLGVQDESTPWFLRTSADAAPVRRIAEVARHLGARLVVAGNWHNHALWRFNDLDVTVVQVGALVPTGWDNPGWDYGRVLLASAGRALRFQRVKGPRFVVSSDDFRHPLAAFASPAFVRIDGDGPAPTLASGGEVVVERRAAIAALPDSLAISAGSVDEALAQAAAGLPEDRRVAAVARAKEHLAATRKGT